MCGIVGYIGDKKSIPILLEGLRRLEYRGYDSAGIAVLNKGEVKIIRRKGRLEELAKAVQDEGFGNHMGVGHTRWATHGKPSEENAHPHRDCKGEFALVHNGIIENFSELKEELKKNGHQFKSETDTEVIAHLIEENYSGDLVEATRRAIEKLEGSFAIALISKHNPHLLIAARKDSSLVVGIGKGEYFIASDIPAILDHTREIIILENDEVAELSKDGVNITTFAGETVKKDTFHVEWDVEAAEKGGYEDFMLKEIYEQPQAVKETIRGRISPSGDIILDELKLTPEDVRKLNKVFIVACGTSYHAGLVAKSVIEEWARLPVEIEISSEFRYRDPVIDENTLVIAITQSGETADTLAGVKVAEEKKARVIAVTNVVGSSVTREVDGVFYTHAGPEIGVAATKTLVSQMAALYILVLYLAQTRGNLPSSKVIYLLKELQGLPEKLEKVLEDTKEIEKCAEKYHQCEDFLFLGRGSGLPVALEGALKLKEISYIHAEGYPAGEMKHGPIALIGDGVPVVAVATTAHTYSKMIGNIQEVKTRNAKVIAIASLGDDNIKQHADHIFYVPTASEYLSPILAVVPLQLLAYFIAKIRGCNVDKPRNLAKSVTVE